MVGAKDSRPPVARMLVQPMHSGPANSAGAVADEKIVEHQPGQGVKGVPPGRSGGRHTEGEASFPQKLPGGLVAAAPQVEVSPEDHGLLRHGGKEMASLHGATGG